MPPKKRSCGKEEEKVSEHYMEPEESMGSKEDVAPERGMGAEKLLEIRNLVKDYGVKGFQSRVLKGIDLTVFKDDFLAIMGPSGSGKTTLLNILSSVDKPTLGNVILDGQDITRLSNKELSRLRRDKIGFIFQDYNLLDTMSLKDNIALPLTLNGVSGRECGRKVEELAAMFGLKEHLGKYPYQLSGGEKQRGGKGNDPDGDPRPLLCLLCQGCLYLKRRRHEVPDQPGHKPPFGRPEGIL